MPGSDQFGGAVDKLKDKAREYLGSQEEDEQSAADGQEGLDQDEGTRQDVRERAEEESQDIRDRF